MPAIVDEVPIFGLSQDVEWILVVIRSYPLEKLLRLSVWPSLYERQQFLKIPELSFEEREFPAESALATLAFLRFI